MTGSGHPRAVSPSIDEEAQASETDHDVPGLRLAAWTWAVVALGSLLRLVRHALDAPLWWNEAFVAVNFLDRSYLDLLKPLDYGQVCPLGFLWIEKAIVDTFGFFEWSLRLYPLLAGIAALVLFARLALRIVPAPAAFLSVCILAMAYHPIRLCAEAKPYASDLLASVVVLWLAAGWRNDRRKAGQSLLWLTLLAPVLIVLSHPVVFVLATASAAPILLGRVPRRALLTLGGSIALGFTSTYLLYTRAQGLATLDSMRVYWHDAFPPLHSPAALLPWLFEAHTGRMFAYPVGGAHSGSALTFALVCLGIVYLAKKGERDLLALLLIPFALTLIAAAFQRHPYGGHPRVAQHLAPAICLLAGMGLDSLRAWFPSSARRRRLLVTFASILLTTGLVPMASEWSRPYRSDSEQRARAFARQDWSSPRTSMPVVSLRGLVPGAPSISADPDVPLMLCNLKIADPDALISSSGAPIDQPTRFVLDYSPRLESPNLQAWLNRLPFPSGSIQKTEQTIHLGRGPRRVLRIDIHPPVPVARRTTTLR